MPSWPALDRGMDERFTRAYFELWEDPEHGTQGAEFLSCSHRLPARHRDVQGQDPGDESPTFRRADTFESFSPRPICWAPQSARYILEVPPLATLSMDELVSLCAPAVSGHLRAADSSARSPEGRPCGDLSRPQLPPSLPMLACRAVTSAPAAAPRALRRAAPRSPTARPPPRACSASANAVSTTPTSASGASRPPPRTCELGRLPCVARFIQCDGPVCRRQGCVAAPIQAFPQRATLERHQVVGKRAGAERRPNSCMTVEMGSSVGTPSRHCRIPNNPSRFRTAADSIGTSEKFRTR